MNRPQPDEYGAFYQGYINIVNDDVLAELTDQLVTLPDFLRSVPVAKADFAYAEGKWTIKELLGHIIDTERIMAYRLLRFARNDATELPGFDENHYVRHSNFATQNFFDLIKEFEAVRKANLYLFKSLTDTDLDRKGIASNSPLSVRALLFILAGHAKHHQKIIEERYLS